MNQDELDEIERVGEEVFAPTVETKFDSVVQDLDETEKDNAIFVANEKAPDQMAESLSLSKQLGVGYDFIDKNKDSLKRFAKQKELSNKLDEIKKTAPRTHDFLLSPENLALSQDEIDELAKLELNINNQSATMQVLNSLDVTAYQTLGMFAKVPAAVWTAYSVPRNIVVKALGFDEVSSTSDVMMKLSEPFDERAAYHRQFTPTANLDFIDELKKGNLGRAAGAAGLQVLQNSGTTAAILGASMVSGGAATGALVGVGAGSGAQHAKEAEEKGASPLQAGVAGVASGFFEAAFEKLELGIFNKMESSLLELFKRPLLETEKKQIALQATKTILGAMGKEALTEGATEASTKFTDYTVGVDPNLSLADFTKETLRAGILGGLSAGALQGPVAVTSSFARATEVKRAVKQNEIILQLAEDAKNSKLLERSPESYADRLDRLLSGSIENIVIPKTAVDALFQDSDKGPSEVIKELGIEKEYAESEKTGADIVMKTSELMARAGKTDMIPKLAPYMKFEGAQASLNEAKANETEDLEVLKQLDKEALEAKQPSIDSQVSEIQKQVKSQLEDMGYPAVEATKNAIAFAQSYKADAIKMQRQPMELFKEFPIGVTSEGIKVGDEVFFQTRQNELGFYSRLEQTISDKMSNTQDVGSLKAMLKDIKPEEMKWSGVEEFLNGKEKVSKTELLDYLRANQIEIKEITKTEDTTYSQWKLPGGENYREVLLTLPGSTETYKSSHFKDTPNILAHTRLQDFTDTDGKKTLLVEEIQSDWHQGGRKKGYKEDLAAEFTPLTESSITEVFDKDSFWSFTFKLSDGKEVDQKVYKQEWDSKQKKKVDAGLTLDSAKQLALSKINEEELRHANYIKERKEAEMVPDAPFKKTWHEFVFKRIARMAAEQGYDKIAWTTGEQQSERYDLSKQIDEIEYQPPTDGKTDFDKKYVIRAKKRDQILIDEAVDKESLADLVGKDIAQKIIDGEGKEKKLRNSKNSLFSLSGLDLKVGGEGMKGFYDKILVDYANKFGKKFGVRVEDISVKSEEKPTQYADFDAYVKAKESGIKVHSLEVTTQMRQSIMKEGQPLFQGSPTDPRGQIRFGKDAINIDLLKNADMSTFLHETGHFFFKVMQDISAKAEAPQDIKDDFNIVKEFLGEVGDKFTVEQQEKFARGFEAYLMEGKAPSKQLQKAFERFKVWLLDVYKSLTNLNVELTPEIRGVFDRMFVAETETSIVENEVNKDLMLSDPHGVLSEADANKYLELKELANKDAKEKLTAKLMKDVVIAQKKEYKAKFEEIKNSTIEKAKELTVFKAIDAIQGDMKLDSNVIKKDFAQFKDSLPPKSTTTKEGAAHPDVVAQVFGYENGQAMLEYIAPYKKGIEDYAENIALGEMKKLYPELLNSPELSNEAIEAYHNDNLRKLKTLELEFLTKESPRIPKEIAARLIRRMPRQADIKEQAIGMIAQSKVSELSPHRYRLAERRSANDAAKAYKRGDFEAAFEAKRKELLAFELYVQAFEAKADVDKSIKSFKKILKSDEEISKNRDVNYVNVAQAILSEFGITRGEKTSAEYLEAMSKYDPEGYANVLQLFTEAVKDADNYKNVSYDKFVSMKESVSAIFDLAKSVKEIEIDGKAMDKEVIIGEMTSQIQKIAPTDKAKYEMTKDKFGKFKVSLLSSKSRMTRIEAWSEAMDIEGRGPFKRYLFQPISDATAKYRLAKSDVMDKYLKLLKDNKKIFSGNVINADELGFAFRNKTELLMALLHSGNMSNLTKLLAGRKWGDVLDNGQLDTTKWDAFISRMQKDGTLTKADYDFVQSVWDLNESLKPDAQKAHKKMFGYYFNEITAQSIQTPWGEYRGGYIPAKADVYSVEDAAIRQEREEFEKNNSSFMFPTTGRGFTKSRSEGYNVPLSLDMNLLGSHIDGVLRFTHIEPRVKELSRLMMDKNFRAELAQVDSEIAKDAIIPWLQRAATQQVISSAKGGDKALDATARFIRKTVAMQIMTGNVVNTVQQFTGLIVAMSKVSPKHISKALFQYVASRNDSVNQAIEKSEWMKSTQGSNIFETQQHINEILVNPTVFENIQNFASKHTYFLQSAAQNIVNTVVWNAAYDQNVTEGKSEIESIRNADAAVRTTQGTTNAEDVSAFETGSPASMLFKQFVSYFNMLANLNASELLKIQRSIGLKKGAGKAFYLYLTALAIPAILSEALVLAMSGQPLDADDDDNYMDDVLGVIFGSQFKTLTAMVPYYGQVAVAAYNQFNNKMYDDRLSLSPAISVIESLTGVPKEIYKDAVDKGEIQKRTVKDTLQLIGVLTGTPIGPIGKPIGYLMDVESGNIKEPTGPVDLVRGLVTGKGNRQ